MVASILVSSKSQDLNLYFLKMLTEALDMGSQLIMQSLGKFS